mmetsp:Transcript_4476/g.10859  ORF Transcript_4476/g.10859 Transcript_4476/m.10859 type:complete len:156 (-) Transcript_4476:2939-3406(-)
MPGSEPRTSGAAALEVPSLVGGGLAEQAGPVASGQQETAAADEGQVQGQVPLGEAPAARAEAPCLALWVQALTAGEKTPGQRQAWGAQEVAGVSCLQLPLVGAAQESTLGQRSGPEAWVRAEPSQAAEARAAVPPADTARLRHGAAWPSCLAAGA